MIPTADSTIPFPEPHKDSDDLQYHATDYNEMLKKIKEAEKKLQAIKKDLANLLLDYETPLEQPKVATLQDLPIPVEPPLQNLPPEPPTNPTDAPLVAESLQEPEKPQSQS